MGPLEKAYFPYRAFTTVDIENQKVFEETCFIVTKRLTIPKSSTISLVIDPTAVAKNKFVLLPVIFKAYDTGPINVNFYSGGTFGADGTLINSLNRNFESSVSAGGVVRLDPTITAKGDLLPLEFCICSAGSPAVAAACGEVKDNFILVLDKTKKYLFELVNQDAVNGGFGWIGFDWFEVD